MDNVNKNGRLLLEISIFSHPCNQLNVIDDNNYKKLPSTTEVFHFQLQTLWT